MLRGAKYRPKRRADLQYGVTTKVKSVLRKGKDRHRSKSPHSKSPRRQRDQQSSPEKVTPGDPGDPNAEEEPTETRDPSLRAFVAEPQKPLTEMMILQHQQKEPQSEFSRQPVQLPDIYFDPEAEEVKNPSRREIQKRLMEMEHKSDSSSTPRRTYRDIPANISQANYGGNTVQFGQKDDLQKYVIQNRVRTEESSSFSSEGEVAIESQSKHSRMSSSRTSKKSWYSKRSLRSATPSQQASGKMDSLLKVMMKGRRLSPKKNPSSRQKQAVVPPLKNISEESDHELRISNRLNVPGQTGRSEDPRILSEDIPRDNAMRPTLDLNIELDLRSVGKRDQQDTQSEGDQAIIDMIDNVREPGDESLPLRVKPEERGEAEVEVIKVFSDGHLHDGEKHRQIYVEKVFSASSTSSVKMVDEESPEMIFEDPNSPPEEKKEVKQLAYDETSPSQLKSGSKMNSSNPFQMAAEQSEEKTEYRSKLFPDPSQKTESLPLPMHTFSFKQADHKQTLAIKKKEPETPNKLAMFLKTRAKDKSSELSVDISSLIIDEDSAEDMDDEEYDASNREDYQRRLKRLDKDNFLKRIAMQDVSRIANQKLDESGRPSASAALQKQSSQSFHIDNASYFRKRSTIRHVMMMEYMEEEIEREQSEIKKFLALGISNLIQEKLKKGGASKTFSDINKIVNETEESLSSDTTEREEEQDLEIDVVSTTEKNMKITYLVAFLSVVDLLTTYLYFIFTFWVDTGELKHDMEEQSSVLTTLLGFVKNFLLFVNPVIGIFIFLKQFHSHDDEMRKTRASRHNSTSGTFKLFGVLIYVIVFWEFKIFWAQKFAVSLAGVSPHYILPDEQRRYFRLAVYMTLFCEVVPFLVIQVLWQHTAGWSLLGKISVLVSLLNYGVQVILNLIRFFYGLYDSADKCQIFYMTFIITPFLFLIMVSDPLIIWLTWYLVDEGEDDPELLATCTMLSNLVTVIFAFTLGQLMLKVGLISYFSSSLRSLVQFFRSKGFRAVYLLNLPGIIMLIMMEMQAQNCMQNLFVVIIFISLVLIFFQLWIVKAGFNRIRKIQKKQIREAKKNQVSFHAQVHKMFKQLPKGEIDQRSIAAQTWAEFGHLKFPMTYQRKLERALTKLLQGVEFNENRLIFSRQETPSGNYYEGQLIIYKPEGYTVLDTFKRDRHGYGRMINPVVSCAMVEGASTGRGQGKREVFDPNKTFETQYIIMEGQWSFGKLDGYGRVILENGDTYIGNYDEGLRSGRGRFFFYNGDLYDGEWRNNKFHGVGSFFHCQSGETYTGEWVHGVMTNFADRFAIVNSEGEEYVKSEEKNSPLFQHLQALKNNS